MNDLIAFGPVLQAEVGRNFFYLIFCSAGKIPVSCVRTVRDGVVSQHLWLIVVRINADTQKMRLRVELGVRLCSLLNLSEVLGHQRAVIRERAAGVDKG